MEKDHQGSNLAKIISVCRKQLKDKDSKIGDLKGVIEKLKHDMVETETK